MRTEEEIKNYIHELEEYQNTNGKDSEIQAEINCLYWVLETK